VTALAVYARKAKTAPNLRSRVLKKQSPTSALEPRLLNIRQAAAYLACNVHAIRQLQWSRAIPSLKIGKFVQFDKKDLDFFVETQKTSAR